MSLAIRKINYIYQTEQAASALLVSQATPRSPISGWYVGSGSQDLATRVIVFKIDTCLGVLYDEAVDPGEWVGHKHPSLKECYMSTICCPHKHGIWIVICECVCVCVRMCICAWTSVMKVYLFTWQKSPLSLCSDNEIHHSSCRWSLCRPDQSAVHRLAKWHVFIVCFT